MKLTSNLLLPRPGCSVVAPAMEHVVKVKTSATVVKLRLQANSYKFQLDETKKKHTKNMSFKKDLIPARRSTDLSVSEIPVTHFLQPCRSMAPPVSVGHECIAAMWLGAVVGRSVG